MQNGSSNSNGGGEARQPLSDAVADCVRRWFQDTLKEAKGGDVNMQVPVSQMYYSGYGVPKDDQKLLLYPNPSHPLISEAGYLMMRDNKRYEQKVKEYCEKYAKKENILGSSVENGSGSEDATDDEDSSSDDEAAGTNEQQHAEP